jgi:hypothetical protein
VLERFDLVRLARDMEALYLALLAEKGISLRSSS